MASLVLTALHVFPRGLGYGLVGQWKEEVRLGVYKSGNCWLKSTPEIDLSYGQFFEIIDHIKAANFGGIFLQKEPP